MEDTSSLRLAILAVFAVFAPVAIYHRFQSATAERLDRWQEGAIILFGLRLGGLPGLAAFIAWMINPSWMEWSSLAYPAWARWLGVCFLACGGILVVWTFRNLGPNLTDTVVTRRHHTLVTTGPYQFVRHPFYLGFGLGLIGVCLAMSNWIALVAAPVPMAFLVARTRIEERKLVERFGQEYLEYMGRVGRFVPGFGRRKASLPQDGA